MSARRGLMSTVIALMALSLVPITDAITASPAGASGGRQLAVSTSGSDGASGSSTAPWRTIQHALGQLEAGDTLTVHGGTYRERVQLSSTAITPGRADAPITVQAAPGERPVIEGLLWLNGADHWTLRGINVTWSTANASNEHMVKLRGGTDWRFTGAEVWGARSFAAILVSSGAQNFSLDNLYVHHTYASNNTNQDHLIYVNNGHTGSGTIERNVLAHSPNGRGVKLGPPSLDVPGTNNITIRYNTFHANTGPSNIQLSGSSNNNDIHHNLLVRSASSKRNITAWNLEGTNNTVHDNLGWDSTGVADSALTDTGNNAMVDPAFTDATNGDYRPTNPAATNHGAHAGTTTDGDTTTTDGGGTTTDGGTTTTDGGTTTDSTAPAAPAGLQAVAGDAAVSLDWSDNGDSDLAGYQVYRTQTSGSGYSHVSSLPAGTSTYVDGSVTNGTTYHYVVTAVDVTGNESSASTEVAATPQAPVVESQPMVVSERYSRFGGKTNDAHLDVQVNVTQGTSALVGRTVTVALYRDGASTPIATGSGTTDSTGAVLFKHRSVGAGCYSVTVVSISGVSEFAESSVTSCS